MLTSANHPSAPFQKKKSAILNVPSTLLRFGFFQSSFVGKCAEGGGGVVGGMENSADKTSSLCRSSMVSLRQRVARRAGPELLDAFGHVTARAGGCDHTTCCSLSILSSHPHPLRLGVVGVRHLAS